jgi:hypothetical protein
MREEGKRARETTTTKKNKKKRIFVRKKSEFSHETKMHGSVTNLEFGIGIAELELVAAHPM